MRPAIAAALAAVMTARRPIAIQMTSSGWALKSSHGIASPTRHNTGTTSTETHRYTIAIPEGLSQKLSGQRPARERSARNTQGMVRTHKIHAVESGVLLASRGVVRTRTVVPTTVKTDAKIVRMTAGSGVVPVAP